MKNIIGYKIVTVILVCVLIATCVRTIMSPQPSDNVAYSETNETVEEEVTYCRAGVANVLQDGIPIRISNLVYDPESIYNEVVQRSLEEEIANEKNRNRADTYSDYDSELSEIVIDEEEHIDVANNKYSEDEVYELAKMIMCEAEGESQKCKEYVGQVILNRVESDTFPDTIHDVIFQKVNGVSQFSPIADGRWNEVEPSQECYDAAYKVINASSPLTNALYFEACRGNSWHARNLTQVAEISRTRFYI